MGVNAEVFAAQTGQYKISCPKRARLESLTDDT
jgi:hypothetical protein